MCLVEIGGVEKVSPGFLAYYPTFWNPSTGQNETPPSTMVEFFAQIKSFIRKIATRVKLGKRSYWVGKQMAVQLKTEAKILGIEGITPAMVRERLA